MDASRSAEGRAWVLGLVTLVGAGCPGEEIAPLNYCETDTDGLAPPDGVWSQEQQNWDDPGAPGLECFQAGTGDDGGCPENPCIEVSEDIPTSIVAHHCYTTAVHAVHLRTREIFMMHGEREQRVWEIGTPPEAVDWHPIPYSSSWWQRVDNRGGESESDCGVEDWCWAERMGLPDTFCSGHVQLYNGELFLASGNVTGNGLGGGLLDTFRFEPFNASPANSAEPLCPFGWQMEQQSSWTNLSPQLNYDRWYPTLTALGDGRVLIAGGDTRHASHDPITLHNPEDGAQLTPLLELFDPTATPPEIIVLDNPEAEFPVELGVPEYPFMFLLPSGDIFYAGSEAADDDATLGQHHGRILLADYNNEGTWEWVDAPVESTIRGGSAAMYRPGMIIKSGGRAHEQHPSLDTSDAVRTTEIVDLSGWPEDPAPEEFDLAQDMHEPRHFHTLTVLPDGRVLATGGNSRGNWNPDRAEHYMTPCSYPPDDMPGEADYDEEDLSLEEGECTSLPCPMDALLCAGGCPSVCINWTPDVNDIGEGCSQSEEELTCSHIRSVTCSDNCGTLLDETECARAQLCEWSGSVCVSTGTCDDILDGATCEGVGTGDHVGFCNRTCTTLWDDCGLIQDCAVPSTRDPSRCSFENVACYATKTAEIWEPGCDGGWTELGDQEFERMYHSTALLLPDARVISMGGGHSDFSWHALREGYVSEYFEPQYAANPNAEGADFKAGIGGLSPTGVDNQVYFRWNENLDVVVDAESPEVSVRSAALVRLGSVTHGFDMDQRLIQLPVTGSWPEFTVLGDSNRLVPNVAPPGFYMLFLISDAGEPGEALYVHVGDDPYWSYVCEVSETFEANETSCTMEPVSGICPTLGVTTNPVDPPMVEGPLGTVSGFRVLVPAGLLDDPTSETTEELAAIEQLCVRACTEHFGGEIGQSANCDEAGAFEVPVQHEEAYPPLDLVRSDASHGEDLFVGQSLECDLTEDCYEAFDEALRVAAPSRFTPAEDALAVGEEFSIGIEGEMAVDSTHASAPVSASLAGTVGYSECVGGNADGPCPFYLGSLELTLAEPLTVVLDCDNEPVTHVVDELTIRLAQPAFGIAEEDTWWRAFPPGALVLEAEGVINGLPFYSRRPNQVPFYAFASGGWIQVQEINGSYIELSVPCGEGQADILASWEFEAEEWPGEPAEVFIDVPSTVSCPDEIELDHTKWDQENDIASLRWLVDGVLMEDGTTSVDFTTGHELTAIVRDERGATCTKRKQVSCQ